MNKKEEIIDAIGTVIAIVAILFFVNFIYYVFGGS